MNNNLQNIARDLNGISLTMQERQVLRQKLVAMMQTRPATAGAWAFVVRHAAACSVVAFVAMAGTGLAAAHSSMPGDLFYPLRLAVNDRIAVAAAGDEDARLDLEIQQMERAIAEEELVADHELAGLVVADVRIETNGKDFEENESEESDVNADLEAGIDLDAELRDLEHLLDDEEHSAEIELSL